MNLLKGYQLQEKELGKGDVAFFKAVREADKKPVFLKILQSHDFDSAEFSNFKREYEISKELDSPAILGAHDFVEFHGGAALVMDQFEGLSLKELISQKKIPFREFLQIGLNLCEGIGYLHSKDIIHKDLKPSNILVNPKTLEIKIIDFENASLIPQEDILADEVSILEGTLQYISPEQTGRMNRSLDYRSDLYSLGVSLYEVLTGRLPFINEDPIEILHAHMAVEPTPPSELVKELPEVISQILLKLLEKEPENRYKSTTGLKYDLQLCLQNLDNTGIIPNFKIAQKDFSDRLKISQKIYGRAEEINDLLESFDQARQGNPQVVFVSGSPGIGKSVLVNEIGRPVVENRGNYIKGKFDQLSRNIPYSAILDAFQELIDHLLTSNQASIANWKARILRELGEHGQILIDVLPSLELIIGPQPNVSEVPPAEALNRFNIVFQGFVKAFTNGPNTLVLFLDDLQWADQASLQLLEFLIADREKRHFQIIGAYRDIEVQKDHPLYKLLVETETKDNVKNIKLNPLGQQDLKQLIADTFNTGIEDVEELSGLIDLKTKRNPFFVSEFIKTLYKKRLVSFNHVKNKWKWSIGKIEKSNITDNVIDLVTDLLHGLEPQTLNLCALGACIGNQFDLRTLAVVNEKSIQDTSKDLWQAVKEGIIIPLSENYRTVPNNLELAEKVSYKFLHDRVQQAAYNTIPEEDNAKIHLKIGRLFKADFDKTKNDAKIFDLVYHLNKGKSLVSDQVERQENAHLNYLAGKRAKSASAFEPAFEYFSSAVNLLPANSWNNYYNLTLQLHNEVAEMAYLSVKPDDLEKYTQAILKNSKSVLDTIKVYIVKIAFYGSQGDHQKSVDHSFEILEKIGVKLPRNPNQLHILGELLKTKLRLRGKSVDTLYNLPQMKDDTWNGAMSILSIVTGPAYIANTNLFVIIVFKMIELSLKHGINKYTSFAFAVLGIVLTGLMDLKGVKMYAQLAGRLLDSYPEDEQYTKVNYIICSLLFYHHPIKKAHEQMIKNIQKGFDSGDFLYASYSVFYSLAYKLYGNFSLSDIIPDFEPLCEKLDSLNQQVGLGWTNSFMQYISNLTNEKEINTSLSGQFFKEQEMLKKMEASKNVSGIALMYYTKGMNSFMFDEYHEALDHFKKAVKYLDSLIGTPMVSAYHFYFSLANVAVFSKANFLKKQLIKRTVSQSINMFEKLAVHSPDNYNSRLQILKGTKNYLKGKYREAKENLRIAIEHADSNDQIYEKALAHELIAKLCYETGEQISFNQHIFEARFHYHQWGAVAKARQLESKYKLQQLSTHHKTREEGIGIESTRISLDSLDLQTVIKASQALSSEVKLESLYKRMINIVMENAGATGCTIILKDEDKWHQEISKLVAGEEDNLIMDPIPLDVENSSKLNIPISVANYVIRTNKILALNNPKESGAFADDEYFIQKDPKSILCFPFRSKGDVLGLIYLENELVADSFSKDRISLISIISTQLAISIENALVYQNLEQKVKARTADLEVKNNELAVEKKKSDKLLLNILPQEIAEELKETGNAQAKHHSSATVLFADVEGFTSIAESLQPSDLVTMLDTYFSRFDEIMIKYNIEKIKTIGDAYMAVSGVPDDNNAAPSNVIKAAQEMISTSKSLEIEYKSKNQPFFQIRIGIHTGPVISGIVGNSKIQFDIWGDTVNVAARLEETSLPGRINISRATYDRIRDEFRCSPRGVLPIKNRSEVEMFFIE